FAQLLLSACLHFQTKSVVCILTDTAPTEMYTLSLHDALPIYPGLADARQRPADAFAGASRSVVAPAGLADRGSALCRLQSADREDRKSTRLNSSHVKISYAVFCLKKKRIADVTQSSTVHFRLA